MFTNGKKVHNLQNNWKILRNNLLDYVIYEDTLTNCLSHGSTWDAVLFISSV